MVGLTSLYEGVLGMVGSDLGRAALSEGTRCTSPNTPLSLLDERCEFSLDIEEEDLAARMSGWGTICDVTEARDRCADIQQAWAGAGGGGGVMQVQGRAEENALASKMMRDRQDEQAVRKRDEQLRLARGKRRVLLVGVVRAERMMR